MRFVTLLESRLARVATRFVLIVGAIAFIVGAIQSALVISRYSVPTGTALWASAAGAGLISAMSGLSSLALALNWRWAVWVWAGSVTLVAIAGLAAGLNRSFLLRWEIALPWVLLIACGALGLKQARPWNHAAGTSR